MEGFTGQEYRLYNIQLSMKEQFYFQVELNVENVILRRLEDDESHEIDTCTYFDTGEPYRALFYALKSHVTESYLFFSGIGPISSNVSFNLKI